MDCIQAIAEIVSNIITSLGIIIAGIWTYIKFIKRNEGRWNANLKVETEIISEKKDENLALVVVTIENIGNTRITPTKNGLVINVFKAKSLGNIDSVADEWEAVQGVEKDILTIYKDEDEDYTKIWSLDSGALYTEKAVICLKEKGLYRLKCKFHIIDKKMPDNEDCLTEYSYFLLKD